VLDTHTATVEWGYGTQSAATVNQGAGTTTATTIATTYADDGVLTLTFTVTDDDGGVGVDTATVTVTNATPTIEANGPFASRLDTALSEVLATFADMGKLDTHTAETGWGDGTVTPGVVDQELGTISGTHRWATDGVFIVSTTVTDDDGALASAVIQVTVEDAPLVSAGGDRSDLEGASVTVTATYIDAVLETHEATFDWGDGTIASATVDQDLNTATGSHTYADSGAYLVMTTVTDDAALVGLDTFTFTITNTSPIADAGLNFSAVEGATTNHDGAFTDAGTLDTHLATVDWGIGPIASATVNQGAGTTSTTTTYADDGVFTLTFTVTDDDGGVGVDTATVTVTNATPTIDANGPFFVRLDTPLTEALATFADQGVNDTHTALIDWGDGGLTSGSVDQILGTITGTHSWAVEGVYAITTTVTDDDGALALAVGQVVVQDAPLVDAGAASAGVEGATVTITVSFLDSALETHEATFDWGDGAIASATVDQDLDTATASCSSHTRCLQP
jgi:hypothetical protein